MTTRKLTKAIVTIVNQDGSTEVINGATVTIEEENWIIQMLNITISPNFRVLPCGLRVVGL